MDFALPPGGPELVLFVPGFAPEPLGRSAGDASSSASPPRPLALRRPARIAGRILRAGGAPASAGIEVAALLPPDDPLAAPWFRLATAFTDEAGRFSLGGLPSSAFVCAEGTAVEVAGLAPGEERRIEVTLP